MTGTSEALESKLEESWNPEPWKVSLKHTKWKFDNLETALPRSSRIREPHDDTVGEGSPLAEVVGEAVLGGDVVEASEEKLLSLLSFVHDGDPINRDIIGRYLKMTNMFLFTKQIQSKEMLNCEDVALTRSVAF